MNSVSGLKLGYFHFRLANFLLVEFDLFLNPDHLKIRVRRLDTRLLVLTVSNQFKLVLEFGYFVFIFSYLVLTLVYDFRVVFCCGGLRFLCVRGFDHAS